MKKQIIKTIGVGAVAVVALAVFAQVWVSGQVQKSERGLSGSWDVQVTPRNCETGMPLPVPVFPAHMTYEQDGTMQETDLGPPGTIRLPGHGIWGHQIARQYSAAFRYLRFAPDRTFIGTNVIRSSITVSLGGNEYTSTDAVEIRDSNGTLTMTGCATQTATRFE